MKKYVTALLTLLAISGLALSSACFLSTPSEETLPPPPPLPPSSEKPPADTKPESEKLLDFPITIVDNLGREVEIGELPQRIVSLAPSNTEILFALGLEDMVVGVTDYCDYPEAAKGKPRVAGYTGPDMEKLVSLEPDLILAEAIHEKTVLPAMEKLGMKVIIMSAESIDIVLDSIALVGQINGKSGLATQLVDGLTQRIESITAKTEALTLEERPRVLYVCWHDPIWTMGSGTFIDDLIWKAGGVNIFTDDFEKSRVVSLESVIAKNPQVIIISGMDTVKDQIYNSIMKETRLKGVDAMINDHIYQISDADLIERPGPRVVDGLEEVAELFHPQMFGSPE